MADPSIPSNNEFADVERNILVAILNRMNNAHDVFSLSRHLRELADWLKTMESLDRPCYIKGNGRADALFLADLLMPTWLILNELANHERLTVRDLAIALKVDKTVASLCMYYLHRLRLVEREKKGRAFEYWMVADAILPGAVPRALALIQMPECETEPITNDFDFNQ